MKRLLPFVIALVLLIGGLVGLSLLFHPESHRADVSRYLSRHLGHPVQIGKLEALFFPPCLRLQDVTVLQATGTPLFHVKQIDALLDWPSLFQARFVPSGLTFNQWTLFTHRRANGTWDYDEWLGAGFQGDGSDAWPLRTLAFQKGEWQWSASDESGPQELLLKDMDVSFDRNRQTARASGSLTMATPVTFMFEGKGQFFSQLKWSGELRLAEAGRQWILKMTGSPGAIDVNGQSSEWRLDNAYAFAKFYIHWPGWAVESDKRAVLHDWKTHFVWMASSMTFYHTASLGDGLMEVKGQVSAEVGDSVLSLRAGAQDLPLQTLFPMAGGLDLDGKLTGFINDFKISLSSRSWSSLSGNGVAEIKNGTLRFPPATLKSLAKAHTLAYFRKKVRDFDEKGLPFTFASADWKASDGMVVLDNGVLKGAGIQAALAGKIDAARHGIDAFLRLQLQETSPALLKQLPKKYVYGAPRHERIQPIFGRVQGSWSEWMLRATPSKKIPAATQLKLRTALK
ncbi:MAG: AsmA-like C-terminal region-containing protein [Elusimicrobiota bacterium]|jgi:hypothetical protein